MELRSAALPIARILIVWALVLNSSSVPAQPSSHSALSFDGVDDLVIVPNHPLLELTDGTLELWFKPDWIPGSITYDPVLIAKRLGAALTRYSLQVDRNLAGVTLANGSSVSTVPYAFTPGQWYHLALSESGSTAQVYVNGLLIGSTANGFGTLIGLPLYLGSDGVGQYFRGQMDEVRIWNIGRSAVEIRHKISRALVGTESGLVAYWRLNEGIGTSAIDATANRLDGTLSGPVWTNSDVAQVNTTGSFGLALDLTATRNTFMQVASAPSLALSNRFTFEAWIKPRSARCGTILSRGDGGNLANTDYIFQVGTDGTNCGVMKLALMVAGDWTTSASTVPLNEWTHVAVNYFGTNRQFYINGLLDRAVTGTGSIHQSGQPFFIGRQGSVCDCNYFDGALDEVRVWNTARTPLQIRTNLTRTLPANEEGLVGYWQFNEQSGIRCADGSRMSNHGLLFSRPSRAPSFWSPVVTVNGSNPWSQECHASFSEPGTTANGPVVAISAGLYHSLALRRDGTVRGWGNNQNGQINAPPSAVNVVAMAGGHHHSMALRADRTVVGWGNQNAVPVGATDVLAIASGYSHTLVLKIDGTVSGWGDNSYGQTDVPSSATNVVAIAAGGHTSLALRADGAIIGWGNNDYGQTVIPSGANGAIALATGGGHCLALKADGTVRAWGQNDSGQNNIPTSATNIVAIADGGWNSMALRADGRVIVWGTPGSELHNIPADATNIVAIAAGLNHGLALRADGKVFTWGRRDYDLDIVPTDISRLNLPSTVRGSVNQDIPGTYALTYVTPNAAGAVTTATRTVVVADTAPPILMLNGSSPLSLDAGTPFVDPGANATDACEGNLTFSIVRTGTVNAIVPGVYTLTYTVTDSSGNRAAMNRSVLVRSSPSVLGFTAFFSGTNTVTGSPVVQFLADVNPNGLATVAFAQYGLNTSYPGRTALVNLSASYDTSTFYVTLDGLIPGATYHFRVVSSNSLGVAYGPDETFTVPMLFAPGDINGDGRVDQSELNSVLSNYWPHSPWLSMTNLTTFSDGLFQFALTNAGGWNFSVLASTNPAAPLAGWTNIGLAWPVWQFLDSDSSNQPQRYYRLRWP